MDEITEQQREDASVVRWKFERSLQAFAAALASSVAQDREPYGRFSRAYLRLGPYVLEPFAKDPNWSSSGLDLIWFGWLRDQISLYGKEEEQPPLEAVRYAADGVFFASMIGRTSKDLPKLMMLLEGMTHQTT